MRGFVSTLKVFTYCTCCRREHSLQAGEATTSIPLRTWFRILITSRPWPLSETHNEFFLWSLKIDSATDSTDVLWKGFKVRCVPVVTTLFLSIVCRLFDEWMSSREASSQTFKSMCAFSMIMLHFNVYVWWCTCSLFHFPFTFSCHRLFVVIHSTRCSPIDSLGSKYSTGIEDRESFDSLAEYYNRKRNLHVIYLKRERKIGGNAENYSSDIMTGTSNDENERKDRQRIPN